MSQNSYEPSPPADKLELHCRQQLSALLDGELPADEARFLLRRLQHDQELAGCLERWQLTGALLRRQIRVVAPLDFSQKVAAAVQTDAEISHAASDASSRSRWLKWGGGAALVASVATVALFVSREQSMAPEWRSSTMPIVAVEATVARNNATAQRVKLQLDTVDATARVSESLTVATRGIEESVSEMRPTERTSASTAVAVTSEAVDTTVRPASIDRRARPVTVTQISTSPTPPAVDTVVPLAVVPEPVPMTTSESPPAVTYVSLESVAVPSLETNAAASSEPIAESSIASPRPWPRSTLWPSSGAFNAGYPATQYRVDAGASPELISAEALFPPVDNGSVSDGSPAHGPPVQ